MRHTKRPWGGFVVRAYYVKGRLDDQVGWLPNRGQGWNQERAQSSRVDRHDCHVPWHRQTQGVEGAQRSYGLCVVGRKKPVGSVLA